MTLSPRDPIPTPFPDSIAPQAIAIRDAVHDLAHQSQDSVAETLALLRLLEGLHREICLSSFQNLLPRNRQHLYALLREIESKGGWPYIPRMTLRSILQSLDAETYGESQAPDTPPT
jgi:hypothetical protein